jgi:hypothetical protein
MTAISIDPLLPMSRDAVRRPLLLTTLLLGFSVSIGELGAGLCEARVSDRARKSRYIDGRLQNDEFVLTSRGPHKL